jgi:hypothetical protein
MDCPKDETHEDPIGVASAPLSILHEAQNGASPDSRDPRRQP